jgi:hypothetical protein
VEEKVRIKEVIIKITATPVVNLLRNPIAPELPKIVWLAPPKAAPISAPFPAWRRTIMIRAIQTKICRTVTIAMVYNPLKSDLRFQISDLTCLPQAGIEFKNLKSKI